MDVHRRRLQERCLATYNLRPLCSSLGTLHHNEHHAKNLRDTYTLAESAHMDMVESSRWQYIEPTITQLRT
jgi:hypothetical protein